MSFCKTYHWRVVPVADGVIVSLLGRPSWLARWELDEQNNFEGFPCLTKVKPAKVYLDCSTLEYLGSAGHGALIKLSRATRSWNGRLVLCNVRHSVAEPLEVSKLTKAKLFDMCNDGLPAALPVLPDPSWLQWNEGAVLKLAAKIKAESVCNSLIDLGELLENAGCTDADILAHCRGPGPHVRGCWVLDLLHGKV